MKMPINEKKITAENGILQVSPNQEKWRTMTLKKRLVRKHLQPAMHPCTLLHPTRSRAEEKEKPERWFSAKEKKAETKKLLTCSGKLWSMLLYFWKAKL